MLDLETLAHDFRDVHDRDPVVIVVHPDDLDLAAHWLNPGNARYGRAGAGVGSVGGLRIARSRDVERGRPELY